MEVKRTKNKCYNFKLIDNSTPENSTIKLYRTAQDICDFYKCCKRTLYKKIKNPKIKSKYFDNVEIIKVKIPIKVLVENPNLNNIINSIEINDKTEIYNQINRNKLSNEEFTPKLTYTNLGKTHILAS